MIHRKNEKVKQEYELLEGINTNMSFAVVGNKEKFLKHRHAWKAWRMFKEFRCKVYPVAGDLARIEGSKVYSSLEELQGMVDVVVLCVHLDIEPGIADKAAQIGASYIWFQEKNWTEEIDIRCRENGLIVVRGCVLKHKVFQKPFAYLNPCFWHGIGQPKMPSRY